MASEELAVPGIGTVVDLRDVKEMAVALDDIRELEWKLRMAKKELTDALVEQAQQEGTKTLHFEGGIATLRFGEERRYDPEEIEQGLRAAGMPEERIRDVVKEVVTYKVDGNEAKRVSSANPAYAKVIEEHTTLVETTPSVSVKRS